MSLKRNSRSEDSYIYQDILPSFEDYGYPDRTDTQNLRIKDIRIRIGSKTYRPDVVYFADGVPVLLVEAKEEGKSKKDAEEQVRSYVLNFPIKEYSRDGRPPQYAAVTVGRRIYFYRYERDTNQYGGIVDRLIELPSILTYAELRQQYGLVKRKPKIEPHSFKAVFYALVSAFDIQGKREVNPGIVLKTVGVLLEFLKDHDEYLTRKPYTDLGRFPHIQRMIRSTLSQYDWSVLTPEIAHQFRSIVLRAFQGSKQLNQYITPWPVVTFMTELAEVSEKTRVLDFECGSGGYLAAALDKGVPINNLKGTDIADLPYCVAKVFLALHSNVQDGDIETKIHVSRQNGLLSLGTDWDVVIGNPAGGNKYTLNDLNKVYKHLERDLNHDGKGEPTWEYNFSVQQAVRAAKVGGKMCLVLPEGFFSNETAEFLRGYVAANCRIQAIIGLPRGVFYIGKTTRTVESGKTGSSQKMSIILAKKIRKQADRKMPRLSERYLDYPVFLAAIDKPRNLRGNPNWLNRALSEVLRAYYEWQQGQSG